MIARAIWVSRSEYFNLLNMTETKITDQAYCQKRMGYDVPCSKAITTADGNAQGGLGMVVRDRPQGWSIESTRFHWENVVI